MDNPKGRALKRRIAKNKANARIKELEAKVLLLKRELGVIKKRAWMD